MPVFVVEGQTGDFLSEELSVPVCQNLFFLFPEHLFRSVGQCTEYVLGRLVVFSIFGNTRAMHILPVALMLFPASVPSNCTFCGFLSMNQTSQEFLIYDDVFRVYVVEAFLIAHTILG